MSPPKENIKPNLDADLKNLKAIVDAPEDKNKSPEPEGKVIPLHPKVDQAITDEEKEELKILQQHYRDLEKLREGFALMTKRHKYYLETKEILDLENKALPALLQRRDQLEKKLFNQQELDELFALRTKSAEDVEAKALAKVRADIEAQNGGHPEETALVPQPKQEVKKHKDWGAWRRSYKEVWKRSDTFGEDKAAIIALAPFWTVADIANWTYRKIQRLRGKGADLDGEKEGWHVGDMVLPKAVVYRTYKIEGAKSIKIVGVTNNEITIEMDGEKGKSIYIPKEYFTKYFYKVPQTPEENGPKTFTDTYNHKFYSTGEQEKYGIHIGTKVRLKNYKTNIFEIIGFNKQGDVILSEKGRMVENNVDTFRSIFEPVPETTEGKGEPKMFTGINGDKVWSTGEEENYYLHIGQKLRLKPDAHLKDFYEHLREKILAARSFKVVGFDENHPSLAIVQLDGKEVMFVESHNLSHQFEKIP